MKSCQVRTQFCNTFKLYIVPCWGWPPFPTKKYDIAVRTTKEEGRSRAYPCIENLIIYLHLGREILGRENLFQKIPRKESL